MFSRRKKERRKNSIYFNKFSLSSPVRNFDIYFLHGRKNRIIFRIRDGTIETILARSGMESFTTEDFPISAHCICNLNRRSLSKKEKKEKKRKICHQKMAKWSLGRNSVRRFSDSSISGILIYVALDRTRFIFVFCECQFFCNGHLADGAMRYSHGWTERRH